MEKDLKHSEQLSALMDGELDVAARADVLQYACDEGQSTWALYHLVGDVLRSPELAGPASSPLLERVRQQLAQEPVFPRSTLDMASENSAVVQVPAQQVAANSSVFRWKMVAGFASLAAVAAVGWSSFSAVQGGAGQQLATAPVAPSAGVVAVSEGAGQPVMLRDPRLDELLQAHKQFGSTSALQMPAGFLRNATFEEPSR